MSTPSLIAVRDDSSMSSTVTETDPFSHEATNGATRTFPMSQRGVLRPGRHACDHQGERDY